MSKNTDNRSVFNFEWNEIETVDVEVGFIIGCTTSSLDIEDLVSEPDQVTNDEWNMLKREKLDVAPDESSACDDRASA